MLGGGTAMYKPGLLHGPCLGGCMSSVRLLERLCGHQKPCRRAQAILAKSAACSQPNYLPACRPQLTKPYLSDPQVERVVPGIAVHLLSQQPVGLHHDQGVAGLHAEQDVVVVVVAADVGKLERALDHAAGRVPVVAQDTRRQTAVVGANAHGPVQALTLLYQRREHLQSGSGFGSRGN